MAGLGSGSVGKGPAAAGVGPSVACRRRAQATFRNPWTAVFGIGNAGCEKWRNEKAIKPLISNETAK
jgi:hypothetical protein